MQKIRCAAALAVALPLALAGLPVPAAAHVVLEYPVAPAGTSYKATFKVGHGCGVSPTREISVQIPAGVRSAHPMPKPGWTLTLQRGPVAQGEDVVRITWTAKTVEDMLASTHYDEFVLVARLPEHAGPMYWPVSQLCAEGRQDWVEVPGVKQKLSELKSPAALLEVLPNDTGGGHRH